MADMAQAVDELRLKMDSATLLCKHSPSSQPSSPGDLASTSPQDSKDDPVSSAVSFPPNLYESSDMAATTSGEALIAEASGPHDVANVFYDSFDAMASSETGISETSGLVNVVNAFPQDVAYERHESFGRGLGDFHGSYAVHESFDATASSETGISEASGLVNVENAFPQDTAYEGHESFDRGLRDFHGSYAVHESFDATASSETGISEAPGLVNVANAFPQDVAYEGHESFDHGVGDFHGSYAVHESFDATASSETEFSEASGLVNVANAFPQDTAFEGHESFDRVVGDFHGSYAVHGVYPLMDHNYAVPPFYDQAYMHHYNPYAFQADYAFVPQPFPSEVQFAPSQGNIAYGYAQNHVLQYQGYQQEAGNHAFQHYSPYNSPLPDGGMVMLDGQETSQPNIASFTVPIPPLTLPPGGTIMLDPAQAGVVCMSSYPNMNNLTRPIIGLEHPRSTATDLQVPLLQPQAELVSSLNAAAGPFTPSFGYTLPGVPISDKGAMIAYPMFQDAKGMATSEAWHTSRNPRSHSGFFHSSAYSLQNCGPSTAICLTPECSGFTKGRTPLVDVTTNYNGFDDRLGYLTSNGKNRMMSRRGRNGYVNNNLRSRVEWAPISKNVVAVKLEPEAKKLEPSDISEDYQQYNRADFVTEYEDAKHFIIKSFSEANIRQSVKFKVWSSTLNGNKKLDQAYEEAQSRAQGKVNGCPVFLFFSVNGSGQFCGVAEMVSRVDYTKTMDCWDRVRWSGSFPVKWHIIKNVPNFQLHGIILQDNENKPVTNSRDTQEVNFQQGLQMLNIFKKYYARSWILDDSNIHQNCMTNSQDSPPKYQPKVYQVVTKVESEKVAISEGGEDTRENTS